MFELVKDIREMAIRKSLLDTELKVAEANVTKEVTTNVMYFKNDKPPSQTYIDTTWAYTGLNGELVEKRYELVKLQAEIEYAKASYDLMKLMIEIWRTQSANERIAL